MAGDPAHDLAGGQHDDTEPLFGVPVSRFAQLWTALAAVSVVVGLVPPLAIWARRYVLAEALQFVLLGYVAPPLFVLGMSPRARDKLSSWPPLQFARRPRTAGAPEPTPTEPAPAGSSPEARATRDRLAPRTSRPGRGEFDAAAARAWLAFGVFLAVVLVWRISPAVDALAQHWWLSLVEAAVVVPTGLWLWSHLFDSPDAVKGVGRPRRMAIATLTMWAIWAISYAVGFSSDALFPAFHHSATSAVGLITDQEVAVGILWAVPGLAFSPIVFTNLHRWLKSQDLG